MCDAITQTWNTLTCRLEAAQWLGYFISHLPDDGLSSSSNPWLGCFTATGGASVTSTFSTIIIIIIIIIIMIIV